MCKLCQSQIIYQTLDQIKNEEDFLRIFESDFKDSLSVFEGENLVYEKIKDDPEPDFDYVAFY